MIFAQFIEWVFYAVVSGGVILSVQILKKLTDSINELNVKVAIIIEKTSYHEEQIKNGDKRITDLSTRLSILESLKN